MKPKLFLHLSFLFLFIVCLAQSSHAISEFGQNPFSSTTVTSAENLKMMLTEQEADVRRGLQKAGRADVADALYTQLPDMTITEEEFEKGQYFPWMFYRKNGKGPVLIDKDVVWEGETSFTAYQFSVDSNDNRFTFVVPPVCGNLVLKSVTPVPVEPKPAMAAPAPPEPVEVPEAVVMEEKVEKAFPFPIVVDAGYLHQLDPANHLLFRIGIEHFYNDNFSVLAMVGASPKLDGTESTSAFVLDVFANYNWTNKFYTGLGFGGWLTDGDSDIDHEDSDFDVILNIGWQVYEKPETFTTDIFVEVRSAVDELDDFDKFGRLGAGLRFTF